MASSRSLGTRTLRGMFWAYGSYVGGRLLTLVATAILARLLTPREFGLVALAILFMFLLETLSDLGVSQALVIVKEEDELEQRRDGVRVEHRPGSGVLDHHRGGQPAGGGLLRPAGPGRAARRAGTAVLHPLDRSLTHFALAQKRIDFRPAPLRSCRT